MKAILYGGKSHGSILHGVPDNLRTVTERDQDYAYHEFLFNTNVAIFKTGKAKPKADTLAEWSRLLSDPAAFKGSPRLTGKRPLLKHEPENPHLHGDKYVRDCFKNKV
jgi:hypothetical protein